MNLNLVIFSEMEVQIALRDALRQEGDEVQYFPRYH
jgi:hypothetical protein